MDVDEDGEVVLGLDFGQPFEALGEAGTAVGADGGAVGLVVGGLEDEGDVLFFREGGEAGGEVEDGFAAFHGAGARDQGEAGAGAAEGDGAGADGAGLGWREGGREGGRGGGLFHSTPPSVQGTR